MNQEKFCQFKTKICKEVNISCKSVNQQNYFWLEDFPKTDSKIAWEKDIKLKWFLFYEVLTLEGCSKQLKSFPKDLMYFFWRDCASWNCSFECFVFQNITSSFKHHDLDIFKLWIFASIFTLRDTTSNKQETFVVHNKRLCTCID